MNKDFLFFLYLNGKPEYYSGYFYYNIIYLDEDFAVHRDNQDVVYFAEFDENGYWKYFNEKNMW